MPVAWLVRENLIEVRHLVLVQWFGLSLSVDSWYSNSPSHGSEGEGEGEGGVGGIEPGFR